MTTLLLYLVIAAVIGIVLFFLAVAVFGRGEQMAALDPRTSPAELPDQDVSGEDVRKIRFALAMRGYRMSDVDWTLDRLAQQLDSLNEQIVGLRTATPMAPSPAEPDEVDLPGQNPHRLTAKAAELDSGVFEESRHTWADPSTAPSTSHSTVPGGVR